MTKRLMTLIALGLMTLNLGGCIAIAAAGAGYMIGDEINEGDGKLDPLEDVRGKGDGKN